VQGAYVEINVAPSLDTTFTIDVSNYALDYKNGINDCNITILFFQSYKQNFAYTATFSNPAFNSLVTIVETNSSSQTQLDSNSYDENSDIINYQISFNRQNSYYRALL
jgi:hypothetical protein